MPLRVRQLSTLTLRHRVVEEIRQTILNGSVPPGERLVERDLAARFGTSLTVVREAVIQLEAEGLIIKRSNSSTHVTTLSPGDCDQIFSVRRILEEYAFVEAARHGSLAEIEQLMQMHKSAVQSAKAGNGRRYILQDLAWHELVWQMSRNKCLHETLKRIVVPLFGFSLIITATKKGFDLQGDARSHEPILKAISMHDPEATRRAYNSAAEVWAMALRH